MIAGASLIYKISIMIKKNESEMMCSLLNHMNNPVHFSFFLNKFFPK